MDEDGEAVLGRFQQEVEHCRKFFYITRGQEFIEAACDRLSALLPGVAKIKKKAIAGRDEDTANAMLSIEAMISALACELRMWVALKSDDPNAAWGHLVSAQGAIHTACLAHELGGTLTHYPERLAALEQLIFPPERFMSVGIVIEESKCSICDSDYGECGHVKGRPYMGQICTRTITKWSVREVSVVPDPANKECRVFQFTENGVTRDCMTWREVPEETAEDLTDSPGPQVPEDSVEGP